MTTFERIKKLANSHGETNLSSLSTKLGLGASTIYKWKDRDPKAEDLKKVAKHFDVSVDYLVGNDDTPTDGPEAVKHSLGTVMSFDGKPVTEHDRQVLQDIVESYLRNKK